MTYKFLIDQLKLSIPLICIILLICLMMGFYYIRIKYGSGWRSNHTDTGIDLTTIDDIKTMRSEMMDLSVSTIKYIRSNYSQKLQDLAKILWKRRGNSDQWSMAIATEDIDNYKKGDIIWSGDPGLLCSGNIPFCNIASKYIKLLRNSKKGEHINIKKVIDDHSDLGINMESGINGSTWIVTIGNVRTKDGHWIKRSEGFVYPIHDRRIMLFTFGVYDYTGILYDFDEDFQKNMQKAFGIKN